MNRLKIIVFGDALHPFRTIDWVLGYKGYHVKVAASPAAALSALINRNYDLVIAKLAMEDIESLDVLKRATQLNPDVKLLVIADSSNVAFPLESNQIEVDDYLLMPMSYRELMRRVGQCLERVSDLKG